MLQTRTVEPRTLELLKEIQSLPLLKDFYLVGGTSLALQIGHRVSVDLDLFTTQDFKSNDIIELLNSRYNIEIIIEEQKMLITNIEKVKVDFVKMAYPILFQPTIIDSVRMLDIKDISAMKLKAITQRGSKKDFYDLFYLFEYLTINEMVDIFKRKFELSEVFHVIKSLTYFDDAENQPNPIVFDKAVTWKNVKQKIEYEIKRF
jgi:predicted nucleotidyltransferase component of viral defense system